MGFFDRLFGREKKQQQTEQVPQKVAPPIKVERDDHWRDIPRYIEPSHESAMLASAIATSIAAGDEPDSKFEVIHVWEQNPEIKLVSLIATSIAAADEPDSHFVVKKIYREM